MTEAEFFALPETEQVRLLHLDFKASMLRTVIDSAKKLGPVPRRKATIGFRVSNGPLVVHFESMVVGSSGGCFATAGQKRDALGEARIVRRAYKLRSMPSLISTSAHQLRLPPCPLNQHPRQRIR